MRAIFEDVEGGHGGCAEAVDEKRLELAFEEVQAYDGEGEGLQVGRSRAVLDVG